MPDMQMPDGVTPKEGQNNKEVSKETKNLVSSLGKMVQGVGNQVKEFSGSVKDSVVPKLEQVGEQLKSATTKTFGTALTAGLGPLNLLTGVIKDISGFDLQEKITSGFSGLFSTLNPFKPSKKNPKPDDVAKKGDAGSLLLFNFFKKKEKGDEKGGGGFLSSLLGGGAGGIAGRLLPMLAKGGGILALIGGIVWAVVDGLKGAKLSVEWGTSKFSGIVGAVLGGTDKGLMGALKGMGKWALIGAGIGSIFPVVGTLIGGLIGAGVGAILGWIGGEKIAKALDAVGKWASKVWKNVVEGIKNFISSVGDFFKKIWSGLSTGVVNTVQFVNEWIITPISEFITRVWGQVTTGVDRAWGWVTEWIITPVGEFFTGVWKDAKQAFSNVVDFLNDWVIEPMRGLFAMVGDAIANGLYLLKGAESIWNRERRQAEEITKREGQNLEGINQFLIDRGVTERSDLGRLTLERLLTENPEVLSALQSSSIKRQYNVNDAIIKDDTIIEPHPDDTLIATKNPIMNLGGLQGGGNVEGLLRELINAVREQDLTVNVPTNFDQYRSQEIREF